VSIRRSVFYRQQECPTGCPPLPTVKTNGCISKQALLLVRPTYIAVRVLGRLRNEVGDTTLLLPFKHEDVRLTLADRAHGPGQRLEVGGKLDLLGPRDLALYLVGDFQNALVYSAR
jgi:hypothetical protein